MLAERCVRKLLEKADVKIGGDRPWDIAIHDKRLYRRVLLQGTLGLGEAYMEGWWDCEAIDVLVCRALLAHIEGLCRFSLPAMLGGLYGLARNPQSRARAFIVAERHYDSGNALFERMLGPSMNYSCGYWRGVSSLDDAQNAKMAMICRKLEIAEGQRVLDVGCGWGGLAKYMARTCGARVTGITVSKEQLRYAREHDSEGLVTWILADYRALGETFCDCYDRVVSVGMFEHVGRKNYAAFMKRIRRVLRPDGLFLLHSIGTNGDTSGSDPWLCRYIFPNGALPSPQALSRAVSGRFVLEDWHNFGADYDRTLVAWHENFEAGCEENAFACSPVERRMYKYYLLSCAGAFRARAIQLWQLVLSPHGVNGGYDCRFAGK